MVEVGRMYEITEDEFKSFVDVYVEKYHPLKFREIPAKEKRKYIILCMVIHSFDVDTFYHEKEVNQILKPMVDDYVMIRRYLVDYGFMKRTDDGKSYWLNKDPQDFKKFILA